MKVLGALHRIHRPLFASYGQSVNSAPIFTSYLSFPGAYSPNSTTLISPRTQPAVKARGNRQACCYSLSYSKPIRPSKIYSRIQSQRSMYNVPQQQVWASKIWVTAEDDIEVQSVPLSMKDILELDRSIHPRDLSIFDSLITITETGVSIVFLFVGWHMTMRLHITI